mmetsp:Transcript_42822/g.130237  ORF Transcript_42822/g.130237 Transcript_42822/m.130237 type:complete len:211 (-) Transcript_42822:1367-1999(-)
MDPGGAVRPSLPVGKGAASARRGGSAPPRRSGGDPPPPSSNRGAGPGSVPPGGGRGAVGRERFDRSTGKGGGSAPFRSRGRRGSDERRRDRGDGGPGAPPSHPGVPRRLPPLRHPPSRGRPARRTRPPLPLLRGPRPALRHTLPLRRPDHPDGIHRTGTAGNGVGGRPVRRSIGVLGETHAAVPAVPRGFGRDARCRVGPRNDRGAGGVL